MNAVCFALGIALGAYFLVAFPLVLVCTAVAVFCALYGLLPSQYGLRVIGLNLIFFSLGFLRADIQSQQWLMNKLTPQWVGHEIVVMGTMASLPIEETRYTRFLFHTDTFANHPHALNLQLSWQNPHPPLHVGERWRLTVG